MIEDRDHNFSDNITRATFIVILGLVALSGCQSPTREQPPAPEVVSTASNETVSKLLARAETAFANNRLTTPIDDNAYLWFLQALAIDTHNKAANTGISDIVEKYLSWAISNSDTGSAQRAFDYLNKAKSVDETHLGIAAVEVYLNAKTTIHTARFPINDTQLRQKNAVTQSKLREIAEEINRLDASIVIYAPTDNLGRWIYQQLNNNTRSRISAVFESSNNPRVVLQYE